MAQFKAQLVKWLLHLVALLPLTASRALGRFAAQLYWPFGGRSRKVTLKNIRSAYPELSEAEVTALAKRSLLATGELIGETAYVWTRPWSKVSRLIKESHGVELIINAQKEGRGVVMLGPHVGNWEVLGQHLPTLGRIVSIYEPPKVASLGLVIKEARQRSGGTMIPAGSRGLAKLIRNLKTGGLAGILPDQVPSELSAGQNSLFMGIPCFTGTLACNIIRRTGAIAIFGMAQRVPGGFVIRYELAEPELYDADIAVSLAALNRGVETCLSRCVEQYQWEYKRFRVRPKQEPGFYDNI